MATCGARRDSGGLLCNAERGAFGADVLQVGPQQSAYGPDRAHRSVEFKHQNISAVLDELGLPWIGGYIPKRNCQGAIFDAIDRHLTGSPAILDRTPAAVPPAAPASAIFVPAPAPEPAPDLIPKRPRDLVRKFDPFERDYRNRALGSAGEKFVVDLERRRLNEANRPELARCVRWVAREEGDGAGYDVLSFDDSSQTRLIEVTTNISGAPLCNRTASLHD